MKTNRVLQIANLTVTKRKNPNTFRVYAVEGLSPAVNTMGGGNREPLIPVRYESDRLCEQGARRWEPADAGDELPGLRELPDERAEGLHDSDSL